MGSSPSVASSRNNSSSGNSVNSVRQNTNSPADIGARNREARSSAASIPRSARRIGFQEVNLAPAENTVGTSGRGAAVERREGERTSQRDIMQREKTLVPAQDLPTYTRDDGLVLETFFHSSDWSCRCLFRDGQRFQFDKDQKKWVPFRQEWLKMGFLITDKTKCSKDDIAEVEGRRRRRNGEVDVGQVSNDREGSIYLPNRGRLSTYISQERMNVHTFFDPEQGAWIRLPMAWEFHSDFVKQLMADIQEALPDWKDRYDMLATLRSCNYDTSMCISTYLAWDDACKGNKSALVGGRNDADAKALASKEQQIAELSKKVKSLEERMEELKEELETERNARRQAEATVDRLEDNLSAMEAEKSTMAAHVAAMQRPKTPAAMTKQRPAVDQRLIVSMERTTQNLHKDQARLKMDITSAFVVFNKILADVTHSVRDISRCDSGISEELAEMKELYRREALQRKLLYNQLQELRGNIRVFCRCRYDSRSSCCLQFPTDTEVLPPGSKKPLQFDKVFSPKSTQEEIYEDTKPLVTSCVDGYNVCILAYGQTGSGKTYTMQGTRDDPGVNVRALQDLLEICKSRDNIQYQLKASMVEIYNETIHDILSSKVGQLEIRAQGNKIVLPGITELSVETVSDIDEIIEMGQKNRSVAATKMNSQSSRSHLIFTITIRGHDRASGSLSVGTLTLCDLAGSERVSKTEATGQRLVEAAAINKSLSSLGQVFTALRNGQLHVPYRNSKLTHILQPSLGGDAKACLFVMVSPDANNLSETVSTLQFGSNAQQVQLGQAKKNVIKGPAPPDDY